MSNSEQDIQDEPQTETEKERDRLMSKAYSHATSDLRKVHQDEFNDLYQKRCAELGIEWQPRKSKQDQALDTILQLMESYPNLAEKLAVKLTEH